MPRVGEPEFKHGGGDKEGDCWESEAKENYLLGEKKDDHLIVGPAELEEAMREDV